MPLSHRRFLHIKKYITFGNFTAFEALLLSQRNFWNLFITSCRTPFMTSLLTATQSLIFVYFWLVSKFWQYGWHLRACYVQFYLSYIHPLPNYCLCIMLSITNTFHLILLAMLVNFGKDLVKSAIWSLSGKHRTFWHIIATLRKYNSCMQLISV